MLGDRFVSSVIHLYKPTLSHILPPLYPSISYCKHADLRRSAGSGLGLAVGLGDVLDLALLAVLELSLSGNILHKGSQHCSYLPSGGTQLRDASALSDHSLLLLQASADDAGGDREVLVVAKESSVSKIFRRRVDDGRVVGRQLS